MQNRSYLFLLLVVVLGGLSGWLFEAKAPTYGLDVSGGIRLTYEIEVNTLPLEKRADAISKTIDILDARAKSMAGEGTAQSRGGDQAIVELPGISNINQALEQMGSSAKMQMFWASNLTTEKNPPGRKYTEIPSTDPDDPSVSFSENGTGKVIKPGDPEYAAIIKQWGKPILEGEDLKEAGSQPSGEGYIPTMTFNQNGTAKLAAWTTKYFNTGEKLAYVLDGKVLNVAPLAPNTTITNGAAQITGQFSSTYVTRLKDLLNGGSLPVDLKQLSYQKVDPTLGKQALTQILSAGVIGFSVVALFLISYYAFPGIVATIALALYVLFTVSVLKAINATFSLAAIAGFILSVGMAVDANILVFERFKEEMKKGKTLHSSIELGFRRALPAIMDSNACTILTSLVLVSLGTGPVKGFATTLIFGVLISLFTAVFVTRSLLVFFVDSGIAANPKWYAVERNWFKKLEARADTNPLQVVEKGTKWFLISAATIVVFFFFIGHFKLNVEFQGGYECQYGVAGSTLTNTQYAANLEKAGLKGSNVQFSSDPTSHQTQVIVTVPKSAVLESMVRVVPGVKDPVPDADKQWGYVENAAGITGATNLGINQIGPTIQAETISNAIKAVVLSSLLIIIFLAMRFGFSLGGFVPGLRFGSSAILALVHDILVVVGSAGFVGWLFGWEISSLFITAMLTVIGFSVHDTIVIFDRIRENLRRPEKGHDLGFVMDRSITQSFARSVNTSMTVVVTLGILIAFGTATPELKFFCVAMLVGIVSGTYSSIYNASPILYLWDKAITKKDEKKGLIGLALEEQSKARVMQGAVRAAEAPQVQSTESGRSYGQVRRRASQQQKGHIDIDDEP